MAREPVDIDACLIDPATYESTILRIYAKRNERGMGFHDIADGVTYFDAAADRKALSRAIAASITDGSYEPQPVDLWFLERDGKRRAAHMPGFVDHIVGSALFKLLSHNARCYGLPGVYSYLPGVTNVGAMRAFAAFIRAHREKVGPRGGPLYVLQSDFEKYGDNLPVGPDAALWKTLREVASLGSVRGEISRGALDLITSLIRPVVRDEDGTEFTRLNGVAMGTPLVPVLGNLAVVPMDRAITDIDGVFYARYNDDFMVAHGDLAVLHEADSRIDGLVAELGVKRKLSKELRTALSVHGRPCEADPAYRGRDRIDCLGMSVTATGTVTLGPHRLRRFVARIAALIDAAVPTLSGMTVRERAGHLVAATNVMLDVTSPFAVAGLSALLDTVTDRGSLKDVDYRICAEDRAGGDGGAGSARVPATAAGRAVSGDGAGVVGGAAECAVILRMCPGSGYVEAGADPARVRSLREATEVAAFGLSFSAFFPAPLTLMCAGSGRSSRHGRARRQVHLRRHGMTQVPRDGDRSVTIV